MQPESLSVVAAFVAGMVAFFSPCHLPLLPAYLGFLTGSVTGDQQSVQKNKILFNSLNFVVGFSAVFILLGLVAGWFGGFFAPYQAIVQRIAGVLILLFGLHLAGILSPTLFNRERRVQYRPQAAGPGTSILLGVAFAAGWTPCIGPVLGAMIAYAAATGGGVALFVAFALGMAIPFLVAAFLVEHLSRWLERYRRLLPTVQRIFGIFMVALGITFFFGRFSSF
ncbi:MAG: cytochrome c biogenesis protein CcdA [Firmicutes bacterium]|nr:cytochrome c biogenesis protein CcdA [Bacillota bacterium]